MSKKNAPYLVILSLAKSKGGRLNVSDTDLQAALVTNGKSTAYRLPTYIWEIRKKAQVQVTPVRQGKSVIAYDFPALQALAGPPVDVEPVAVAAVSESAEVVEVVEQFV